MDVAALPFAPPGIIGFADTPEGLCTVGDLTAGDKPLVEDQAQSPRLLARVATSCGPLLICADELSAAKPKDATSEADIEDGEDGAAAVAGLVAGLVAAEETLNAAPVAGFVQPSDRLGRYLIVRAGTGTLALPAITVMSVGRSLNIKQSHITRTITVETAGGLLTGRRLDGLGRSAALPEYDPTAAAGAEWTVILGTGSDPWALLASHVEEVFETPPGGVLSLPEDGSLWLRHPRHGLVEVLDPEALRQGNDETKRIVPPPGAPSNVTFIEPVAAAPTAEGALSLHAGPYVVVAPAAAAIRVLGATDMGARSPRRRPGTTALFDLAAALGAPARPFRAAVLVGGHIPVILAADEIRPAPPDAPWRPLPMLPPLAATLFSAMRLRGGVAEFLLRPPPYPVRDPALRSALARGFAGWLKLENTTC
jgi:hypothetical protein